MRTNEHMRQRVEPLSKRFSKLLCEELTREQMEEVIHKNWDKNSPSQCASHEYCDPNMIMLQAFADTTGISDVYKILKDEDLTALWTDAWTLAIKNDFNHKTNHHADLGY